jgi:glutathionyl-hydroquinone reductase
MKNDLSVIFLECKNNKKILSRHLVGRSACETDYKAFTIVVKFNENIFCAYECSFDLITYEEKMNVCMVH